MMWTGFLGPYHRTRPLPPFELMARYASVTRQEMTFAICNRDLLTDPLADQLVDLMTAVEAMRVCERLKATREECRRAIDGAYAALAAVERALGADS